MYCHYDFFSFGVAVFVIGVGHISSFLSLHNQAKSSKQKVPRDVRNSKGL